LTEFEIQNLFCSSSDRLIHANLSSFFMLGWSLWRRIVVYRGVKKYGKSMCRLYMNGSYPRFKSLTLHLFPFGNHQYFMMI
jgi:hypothetical protein